MIIPSKVIHLVKDVTGVGTYPIIAVSAPHPYRTFQLTATGDTANGSITVEIHRINMIRVYE